MINPSCPDVQKLTVSELLSAYGAIIDELRRRKIVRSSNSPRSDYAELLFCKAFGWSRENNSAAGHDASDNMGRGQAFGSECKSGQPDSDPRKKDWICENLYPEKID
jgi:hypothetical protein